MNFREICDLYTCIYNRKICNHKIKIFQKSENCYIVCDYDLYRDIICSNREYNTYEKAKRRTYVIAHKYSEYDNRFMYNII